MLWDRSKASRAKKLLQKKATRKEERKAAAMAAGVDWYSDESDDESPVSWVYVMPCIQVLVFCLINQDFDLTNWFYVTWDIIQEQKLREPPLPNLLKDEEHHHLILDVRISSFLVLHSLHIFFFPTQVSWLIFYIFFLLDFYETTIFYVMLQL